MARGGCASAGWTSSCIPSAWGLCVFVAVAILTPEPLAGEAVAAAAADEEYSVDVDPVRPAAEDRVVSPPQRQREVCGVFALFDHDKDGF